MMITDYSGQYTLGAPFGFVPPVSPSFYVAASMTAPTYAKGTSPYWNFTEPTDPSYARQSFPGASDSLTPAPYSITLSSFAFPTCSTSWSSTAKYIGIFDALTGGNLWFFLPISRVVTDGVTTLGSTTVTSATAAFVSGDVGSEIQAPGLPLGTTIVTHTSGTAVVVSNEATAAGTALTVAIATPQTVASGDTLTIPGAVLQSQ